MKNLIEFKVIIIELCSDLSSLNIFAQQVVTSKLLLSPQFIFFTLFRITSQLKENGTVNGLALSYKTIRNYC